MGAAAVQVGTTFLLTSRRTTPRWSKRARCQCRELICSLLALPAFEPGASPRREARPSSFPVHTPQPALGLWRSSPLVAARPETAHRVSLQRRSSSVSSTWAEFPPTPTEELHTVPWRREGRP